MGRLHRSTLSIRPSFPPRPLRRFRLEVWSVDSSWALPVSGLLAVVHNLRDRLEILLRLDDRKRMAESLVLNDGGVADTLILAEDAVGKRLPLPSNLQRTVWRVVRTARFANLWTGVRGFQSVASGSRSHSGRLHRRWHVPGRTCVHDYLKWPWRSSSVRPEQRGRTGPRAATRSLSPHKNAWLLAARSRT